MLLLLGIAVLLDTLLCYSKKRGVEAERITTERFSIGDENKVTLILKNNYPFPLQASVID